jgi:IclR family acetate operon transcriptional repressor
MPIREETSRNAGVEQPRRRGRPTTGDAGNGDGGVRSLTRALSLLEDVARSAGGTTLGDLAKRSGLAPSTAHRLLKSLEKRRFVSHDAERGLWFIGVQAFITGAGFLRNRDVTATARPFMRQAMEESGESVNLAIRDGDETVYLSQVESRRMMRALAPIGGRGPLHASGVGKALLSGLDPEVAGDVARGLDYRTYTEKTIRNGIALLDDIARSRSRGYAIDDEEHAVGLRCVAAPIFNEYGETIAAMSISGPVARIADTRLSELGALTRAAAADITLNLGGIAPSHYGPTFS